MPRPSVKIALTLAPALMLLAVVLGPQAGRSETKREQSGRGVEVGSPVNPDRVIGMQKCSQCHAGAIRALMHSQHYHSLDRLVTDPEARDIAENMNIPLAALTKNCLCVSCHGTPQEDDRGRVTAIGGVSCERCHGGADSSPQGPGWINLHAVYGPPGTRLEDETPEHLAWRQAECDARGMVRPGNIYQMAKNCYACHAVPHEALVNEGGHVYDEPFELTEFISGEVRHNFMLDPENNAPFPSLLALRDGETLGGRRRMLFLVGKLVELEVALRCLCTVTAGEEEYPWAEGMAARVVSSRTALREALELLGPAAPETIETAVRRSAWFDPAAALDRQELAEAANEVARVAQQFAQEADGAALGGIDSLIPKTSQGRVYQPR